MPKKLFRVGRSRTGLGLFATDLIPRGTLIAEYKGRRVTNAEADKLEARNSRYMYEINSRWTVDGSGRNNIARYANHSCRPNTESDVIRGERARGRKGGMVILRAIRHIKPDVEITYDYGRDYFNGFLKPIGCKCPKCIEKRQEERRAKRLAKHRAKLRAKRLRAKRRARGSDGKSRSR
jgi:SET domain-containing protein